MQLTIIDQRHDFPNEVSSIDSVFEKIRNYIENTDYYFSHLVIDEVKLYSDFDSYMVEYIEHIRDIKVELLTMQQFLNEVFTSAEEYISRALPQLEVLSDEFYQDLTSETWMKLQQLLEGLQWLNQMIVTIDQGKEHPENWNQYKEYSGKLANELINLEEGINNKDNTLLGDIIQYEIIPLMSDLKSEVTKTIDTIGIRKNLT